ncbi:MAG: SRPBCC family protein [Alphaproteobacteria bacterium]
MWTTIVIIVVIAIAGILILAATKPSIFRVERAARIAAPPEKIFPLIDDFRNWTQWSPWEERDPALKRTYSGAAKGVGTVYAWEGNRKVGAGRMEITESVPVSKIVLKHDFLKPMKAHHTTEFVLQPDGNATNVTWSMYGPAAFMTKIMQVFMDMDRMVGKDFDTGLANMKAAAEK